MSDPVLRVRHLTLKIKIEGQIYSVVKEISFDLKKGQTLALVGESGCGKSLTALALLRILPEPPLLPPEGEVLYHGKNLLTLPSAQMCKIRGKNIAMIFQDPLSALNPVYTIGSQLIEVAKTHLHLEATAAKAVILKALTEAQLPNVEEVIHLYPHQLSGGMLQRAMIAMALICSPDVLIADEPTTALDVTIQAQILKLLKELQKKTGMAILLITHDMNVVTQAADEVSVMYAGDHIETGSLKALFAYPAHPYTQALFAARPHAASRKKKLATIPGFVPSLSQPPEGCLFHPRCRYTMELCKSGKVPSMPLKEKGHSAKCWLYDKELETKLSEHE